MYDNLRAASISFDCSNCGKTFNYQTPVRQNNSGPYFDTFYCAWKYFGDRGDMKAAENAAKIEAMRVK